MDVYECDGCGACCRTWRVFVTQSDAVRASRITVEGREIAEHLWNAEPVAPGEPEPLRWQLFPLPFHEGCVFLGEDQRCGVYASRPTVCREFAAGSPRCQEARQLQSLPPLAPC